MSEWLKNAVFYEIYPQSFLDTNGDGIGDICGITQKLDYIKDLGFNAIWLNPCYLSPFADAGYDVADYKKVAPRYGTNQDLINLFAEAHKRGIHVILDLVPGHTSEQHEWFLQSKLPQKNKYSDRYIWSDCVWHRPEGYSWVAGNADRDGCYMLNFFNSQPALNYGFKDITDATWQIPYTDERVQATFDDMLDVMRFWLDNGADGFRVDMADSLVKNDEDKSATALAQGSCNAGQRLSPSGAGFRVVQRTARHKYGRFPRGLFAQSRRKNDLLRISLSQRTG